MNKRVWVTTLFVALTLMIVVGGWLWSRDGGDNGGPVSLQQAPRYESGPFIISLALTPETPVVGENRLSIRLEDSNGNPISEASIKAVATMPAMGAMPAMQAPADMAEVAPGRYEGVFEPSMSGAWPLTLDIEKQGMGRTRISFDLATGRKGLQLSTGGKRLGGEGMGDDMSDDMGGERDAMAMDGMQSDMPTISLDNRRRQLIGLETDVVRKMPLVREIRAVGRVTLDETRVSDVSLKYEAWVGDLRADFVGKHVEKGEILFGVYSPQLYAAQREYLVTLDRSGRDSDLLAAARQRLDFWDVSDEFVTALRQRGEPLKYVPIRSPRTGTVVEKNVVEGTAHRAGMTLMRIADLSSVWVEAEVYDSELPLVEEGMAAEISLPYLLGARFESEVEYVYPYLSEDSRTGRIRLTLPNPRDGLKPAMYAEVKLQADLGERLVVPESAVVFSGDARVVFVDLGDGRLQPRYLETGQRNEDYIEVISGLEPGDRVVTSGNFLVDAETRLKTGIKQW